MSLLPLPPPLALPPAYTQELHFYSHHRPRSLCRSTPFISHFLPPSLPPQPPSLHHHPLYSPSSLPVLRPVLPHILSIFLRLLNRGGGPFLSSSSGPRNYFPCRRDCLPPAADMHPCQSLTSPRKDQETDIIGEALVRGKDGAGKERENKRKEQSVCRDERK